MIVDRQSVRAILLTPENEILLLRIKSPEGDMFWIAPGGGVEAGENMEEALRRELYEELGLSQFTMGPLVWRRKHTYNWGERRLCQCEQYYIVQAERFEPFMRDAVEAETLDRFQWWPASELANAEERLTPLALAEIVNGYLKHGPPQEPPEVEVLVD